MSRRRTSATSSYGPTSRPEKIHSRETLSVLPTNYTGPATRSLRFESITIGDVPDEEGFDRWPPMPELSPWM